MDDQLSRISKWTVYYWDCSFCCVVQDDARAAALRDDPSLGRTFVEALFGALYEVFNSVVIHLVHIIIVRTNCQSRVIYRPVLAFVTNVLRQFSESSTTLSKSCTCIYMTGVSL